MPSPGVCCALCKTVSLWKFLVQAARLCAMYVRTIWLCPIETIVRVSGQRCIIYKCLPAIWRTFHCFPVGLLVQLERVMKGNIIYFLSRILRIYPPVGGPCLSSHCVPVSLHPAATLSALQSPHVAELHMSHKYFNRFQHEISTCKTTLHKPAMMIYGPQNIACIIGNLIENVFFIPWEDQLQHNKSVVEQKADTRSQSSLRGELSSSLLVSPCLVTLSSSPGSFPHFGAGRERVSPSSCDCSNRITKNCISCLPLSQHCVYLAGTGGRPLIFTGWEPGHI